MRTALDGLSPLLALVLAPLLWGIVGRTKAIVAGRRGAPLLQWYFDVAKLLRKGAVYSTTTTWVFRCGPVVSLAAMLVAATILPFGSGAALLSFSGDAVLFVYLFGLARFATVLSALDTGSSFEGMGASREVTFSALAEPALLLGLLALARITDSLSLSAMLGGLGVAAWSSAGAALALIAFAFLGVFLAENGRIPIDDPTTHLELTMIHEVMVLDHGGPDLAFIFYASALKFWLLGSLLCQIVLPVRSGVAGLDGVATLAGLVLLAILTGLIESSMARLRLPNVPQLLIGACALSGVAILLVL